MLRLILTSILLAGVTTAIQDGFQSTPVMGWNTYNDIACNPTADYMLSTIDALSAKNFLELGYEYVQLDCGWQAFKRQKNGSITYDAKLFPRGITPVSQHAISKGFKWAMYNSMGYYSCDTGIFGRPGSLGYERQDALMFAAWNAAYVKLDNCYVNASEDAPHDPLTDFPSRYGKMSSALRKVGIKGIDICQWGVAYNNSGILEGPAQWAPKISTSYRISDDINTDWSSIYRIMNQAIYINLKYPSGRRQFIDMDLLEVGNEGMTLTEQATHFAIWCTFKSNLMISTSILNMSNSTYAILSNKDLLATNQDSLARPVVLVQRYTDDFDLYTGPLANGDRVVLLVDQSNSARHRTINFSRLGIDSAEVKDLWTGQTAGAAKSHSSKVEPHGSMVLRLSEVQLGTELANGTFHEAEDGILSGQAQIVACSGCSGGKKVAWIDSNSSLIVTGLVTQHRTTDVLFDYLFCDLSDYDGTLDRRAAVSVNGLPPTTIAFPFSGYDWDRDVFQRFRVTLKGFNPGKNNTIKVMGMGGSYAPDMDGLSIV